MILYKHFLNSVEFDEEKFKKAEHEAGVEEAERLPGLADEVFLQQMYEKYQL